MSLPPNPLFNHINMPTNTGFTISTRRLYISYVQPENPDHTTFLVRLWNTDEFIQACGRTSINTPEKAATFLRNRVLADYARNGYGLFFVSLKPYEDAPFEQSRLIGTVSLMKGEPPNAYTVPDIGYAILPEEGGKGYATEAALGLLDYARRELGIVELLGFCSKDDPRSARVLQKVGMEFQGVKKLRVFGGKESAVYTLPGMSTELKVYGIDDD